MKSMQQKDRVLILACLLLTFPSPVTGVEVRLTGSESRCSGRVEILYNGTWGKVCDDRWDLQDAEVVCRQLNCGEALNALIGSFFGPGQGQFWLDDLACSGDERSLTECEHRGFGIHDCDHREDASVICSGVEVRLAGSESNCSGRIEILSRGTWGTVCDDAWDVQDAEVVCKQLNCGEALDAPRGSFFGPGQGPIWLDDVVCSGSEMSLTECKHSGLGKHNCNHREDAGVICSGVQVRLTGSESPCSGRVEFLYSGIWGKICDDQWDLQDAEVVCRQLSCGEALNATGDSFFGPGQGPIWLDDVTCSGSERSLTECKHSGFGIHNCNHREDAGVICSGPPSVPVYAVARILLFLVMVLVVLCVACKTRRQAKHLVTARVKYHRNNDEEDYVNIDAEDKTEKEEDKKIYEDPERLNRREVQEEDQAQDDYDDVDQPFAEPTNQLTILTRTVEVPALFHKAEALDISPIADSCSE